MAAIHQSDPDQRPDDEFIPGIAAHLVVGNAGRLLDGRRTPMRVTGLDDTTGQFTVEILAFEDAGATWQIDYERACIFQFERDCACNDEGRVKEIEAIAAQFDRPMVMPCPPGAREATEKTLTEESAKARRWLGDESDFLREGAALPDSQTRESDPRLLADFERFMRAEGLWAMEDAFSRVFVSAPFGETVKGHRIVIAQLGLAPYEGKVVRDESIFAPPWNDGRRARHVILRLAFLRALFAALDHEHVVLYRGMSTDQPLVPARNDTFVSTSFCRAVAESIFDSFGTTSIGVLWRRPIPVTRLFMTYLETAAMNRQFKEGEAVLLADPDDPVF